MFVGRLFIFLFGTLPAGYVGVCHPWFRQSVGCAEGTYTYVCGQIVHIPVWYTTCRICWSMSSLVQAKCWLCGRNLHICLWADCSYSCLVHYLPDMLQYVILGSGKVLAVRKEPTHMFVGRLFIFLFGTLPAGYVGVCHPWFRQSVGCAEGIYKYDCGQIVHIPVWYTTCRICWSMSSLVQAKCWLCGRNLQICLWADCSYSCLVHYLPDMLEYVILGGWQSVGCAEGTYKYVCGQIVHIPVWYTTCRICWSMSSLIQAKCWLCGRNLHICLWADCSYSCLVHYLPDMLEYVILDSGKVLAVRKELTHMFVGRLFIFLFGTLPAGYVGVCHPWFRQSVGCAEGPYTYVCGQIVHIPVWYTTCRICWSMSSLVGGKVLAVRKEPTHMFVADCSYSCLVHYLPDMLEYVILGGWQFVHCSILTGESVPFFSR